MSDLRFHLIALALAVIPLAGGPARLAAQQREPRDAEAQLARVHRLDSLAMARRARVDSLRIASDVPPRDWVLVEEGMLRVRTTHTLEARVREAARLASAELEPRGGAALRERLARRLPVVREGSTLPIYRMTPFIQVSGDTGRSARFTPHFSLRVGSNARDLADRLVRIAEYVALDGADPEVRAWLMVERVPMRDAPGSSWEESYVELATMESGATRRCGAGDAESCLTALDLLPPGSRRLDSWYEPRDYRSLLHRVRPPNDDSIAVASWISCRERAVDSACVIAAHALGDDRLPIPLPLEARRLLVEEVLHAGGAPAYAQLVGGTGSIRERLERGAGVPLDVVARRWLARVRTARPAPMRIDVTHVMATVVWCTLLVGLAVVRRNA